MKNLLEIIKHYELIYFLFLRDFKSRYKQSLLGFAWAIIQPVVMMIVFTVVFSKIGRFPSEGVPYPVFSYTNLLPWLFFVRATTTAITSLTGHATLLTKINFPRAVLPISSILSSVVDFLLGVTVLVLLMIIYKVPISPGFIWIFPALFGIFLLSAGLSFLGSAVNVFYRDVNFTWPIVSQVWMYLCPIIYPVSMVPERFVNLYMLNPMASFLYTIQGAIFGAHGIGANHLLVAMTISSVIFLLGIVVFHRLEKDFADII